jgi:uncharacterized protein YndB with AHSA1/START domain
MTEPAITITRTFEAPRELVWKEWTEPVRFADWFGGPEVHIPVATVSMDVRAGGAWRATMFAGTIEIRWAGEYREVVEPERLVFTITDRPEEKDHDLITVDLRDLGGERTEMRFQQEGGQSRATYERARYGWGVFFDRIAARLNDESRPAGSS